MRFRSLRSFVVGLPIVTLAALGLGVSAQAGCAPSASDDDGIQEDQGALCGTGYGYYGPCGKKHGYGYGYGYGIKP